MGGQVSLVRSKTEQRVASVVETLKGAPRHRFTYDDLMSQTQTTYDILLYIMGTLVEVGMVERNEEPGIGPGRPKVFFQWIEDREGAQELGS